MNRQRLVVALLVASLVPRTLAGPLPARRAVLVGINDYEDASVRDLSGTHADVSTMRALLVDTFGFSASDVKVLLDREATHDAILTAIADDLAEPSGPEDVAVFYFSGHGSQALDQNDDEGDGWDETLVASDSRRPGIRDVIDDELNAALVALAGKTQNITVMLDSCHSGTAGRGIAVPRRIAPDMRRLEGPAPPRPQSRSTDGSDDLLVLGSNFTLLSGCRADQLSNEDEIEGTVQGAMTHAFAQVARAMPSAKCRDAWPRVQVRVSGSFPSQMPQIEGTGLDSPFFGGRGGVRTQGILVERSADGSALVHAGSLHGLRNGATLSIFAPGGLEEGAATMGTVVVEDADLNESRARWQGPGALPELGRARVDRVAFDGRARKAWIEPALPDALRQSVAAGAAGFASLEVIPGDREADADLRVVREGDVLAVLARDGRALSRSVPVNDGEAAKRLVDQLHGWARWQSLESFDNPYTDLRVAVSLRPAGSPERTPAPASVPDGTPVTARVTNASESPVFFGVLNLSASGRIKLLFPPAGAQDTIASGRGIERTYTLTTPTHADTTDTFMVLASSKPIDLTLFEQDAIRSAPAGASALNRLFAGRIAGAAAREAGEVDVRDWTTARASVRVVNGAPVLSAPRIALYFDEPVEPADVARRLSAGSRAICPGDGGRDCATVEPLTSDGRIVAVAAPVLSARRDLGSGAREQSVGQAFDDAYRAAESAGASYAEPLLEVVMPESGDPPSTRGGEAPPDPLAAGDERWSLKYANVIGAWDELRDAGRAAGHEAKGIRIGHPDTGFTRHPENWQGTPPPVDVAHGHDYVDGDADATDELVQGLLLHPGHGTGSSSVIISPPGCQLPDATQCVWGVAPGATLAPLRVHTSVKMFDTSRLARAIDDASAGRWGAKADVISIAMGGPASRTLHHAVQLAVSRGTLVVAAAGNYVRTVVWPARFEEAVAVTAVNCHCRRWTHASHGGAVDLAAPGQGVWRARATGTAQAGGTTAFSVGMGEGTTFATGTTAGAAALWMAYHRGELDAQGEPLTEHGREFERMRAAGGVADAFRACARASAWRPNDATAPAPAGVTCDAGAGWSPRESGPGILDARKLLDVPLPPTSRDLRPDVLPLFRSLGNELDIARAEMAYRSIFGGAPLPGNERFETEVTYHYLASEEVRAALDDLVSSPPPVDAPVRVRQALRSQDISSALRSALADS